MTTEATESRSDLSPSDDPVGGEAPVNDDVELRSVLRKMVDVLAVSNIVTAALEGTDDDDRRRVAASCRMLEDSLRPLRSHLATVDADDTLAKSCLVRLRQDHGGLTHENRSKVERLWVLACVASRMVHGLRVKNPKPPEATGQGPLTSVQREENKRLVILEAFAGRTKLAGRPWRHLIDVSSVCNLRCRTCYHSLNPNFIYYDYDPTRTGAVGSAMPFADYVNVSGTGEPLLSPSTPEIVKSYADLGAYVELTTNGTLAEKLQTVAPSLSVIHLSMDGAEKTTFETIRFGADFDKICQAIKDLSEDSIRKVNINCVVSRPNSREAAKLVQLGLDLGVGSVTFQEFSAYLPWHDEMRLRPQDRHAFFESLSDFELPEESGLTIVNHIARSGADAPSEGGLDVEESLEAVSRVPPLPKPYTFSWNALADSLEKMAPPALEFINLLVELTPEAKSLHDQELTTDPEELAAMIRAGIENGSARSPACLAPFNLLYVQGDGEIRPCCVLRTQVGSLREASFDAAWNDPAFIGFRGAIQGDRALHPACHGCQDGGRFFGIEHALEVLDREGIDVRRLPRPKDTNLPASVTDHPLVKIWGAEAPPEN
ncbi:MAG TPA: radical SAM protein [Myxococcales bacterium]|nr:radical SAM protein [Myxococcales bacterium]